MRTRLAIAACIAALVTVTGCGHDAAKVVGDKGSDTAVGPTFPAQAKARTVTFDVGQTRTINEGWSDDPLPVQLTLLDVQYRDRLWYYPTFGHRRLTPAKHGVFVLLKWKITNGSTHEDTYNLSPGDYWRSTNMERLPSSETTLTRRANIPDGAAPMPDTLGPGEHTVSWTMWDVPDQPGQIVLHDVFSGGDPYMLDYVIPVDPS